MNPQRIALVATIAASLALAGCGRHASDTETETVVAAATGGKVDVKKNGDQSQVTIKDDKGNEMHMNSGGNVALPKDFPADVHLPGSYTLKTAITVPNGAVLEMHTPASIQAVYSEYDSSMKAGGWTEAMAMQSSDKESVLSFQKPKRNVMVSITAADGGGADVHLQASSDAK
jgi:hypothetical protein